jgi:hypothetical protein
MEETIETVTITVQTMLKSNNLNKQKLPIAYRRHRIAAWPFACV